MNNSLQKSYFHKQPFIPSGAIHDAVSPNSSPLRKRGSFSSSGGFSSPSRQSSPNQKLNYLLDSQTAGWETENQYNFKKNYAVIQEHDNRPAGLPSNAIGRSHSSYAWDLRGGATDKEGIFLIHTALLYMVVIVLLLYFRIYLQPSKLNKYAATRGAKE